MMCVAVGFVRPTVYHFPVHARIKRLAVLCVGWFFIVLGIAGLFLPVLQGILFLLIGLIILSSEYVWAHHLLGKLRSRFPQISRKADEASEKAAAWMRRVSGQRQ
jgi:uncharacterized membrane protein YbaN (DUF454 family)